MGQVPVRLFVFDVPELKGVILLKPKTPRVLYHYCSLSTFKAIMDNRSIWLSDVRRSNDSLELQWIMGQCQYYMLNAWVDYARSVQKERGMEIISSEHFEKFEDLYRLAKSYDAEDDTKNWVFCLTQKSDDLGQWRGYADDGKGMAIGFNTATLKKINFVGDAIRSTSVDFKFNQVHYSKREVKAFFDNVVGFSKITIDMNPDDVLQYMKRAVGLSYIFAPLYKSDKFKDEKEWRIIYSMYIGDLENGQLPGIPNEKNDYSDIFTLEKYAFSQRGNNLVSHLELGLPQMKQVIHSITIGPTASVTPMDIRLYLISIGLLKNVADDSIEIRRSTISYR